MLLKYLLSPFFFLQLSVMEAGGGRTADAVDGSETAEDSATPEAAVLSELGLTETSDLEEQGIEVEAAAEQAEPVVEAATEATKAVEEPAKDVQKAEEEKKGLNEADLAPLESKNPKTNERFQKVTEGYKQEKARAEAATAELEKYKGSFESLKQLGFNDDRAAEDLVQFAGYRNVLATGDVATFKQVIASQIKQFEQMHGKRVAIDVSALDDHDDLKQKVKNFELPEDVALEVARTRATQAREEQAKKTIESQQAEQHQRQEVMNSSIAQVNAMEASWKKTDPDAAALLPHLKAQMERIAKTFPPEQWPAVIEMQYQSLKSAMAQSVSRETVARPLRAAGHTAGLLEPTNPQDAVLQALGLDS